MNDAYVPTTSIAVAERSTDVRATFLTRTYLHLFGAIAVFTALEIALYRFGLMRSLAVAFQGRWFLVLGGFMLVGTLASGTAHKARSLGVQYLALFGFIVAEALIFAPLLYYAALYEPRVLESAALVTLTGFATLTGIALFTRKDFSFLRGLVMWGGLSALLLIGASLLFGWQLGTWFSVGMVVFAGATILYNTSKVLHQYPEDRYVAASLELFSSVALLFWYVLQLMMSRD